MAGLGREGGGRGRARAFGLPHFPAAVPLPAGRARCRRLQCRRVGRSRHGRVMAGYAVPITVGLLVLLLLLRVPVAFGILLSASIGMAMVSGTDVLLGVLETVPLSSVANYEFVTVPMFLLIAEFVILSGVADGIFSAAAAWVGRVRGGLAI